MFRGASRRELAVIAALLLLAMAVGYAMAKSQLAVTIVYAAMGLAILVLGALHLFVAPRWERERREREAAQAEPTERPRSGSRA